ncbi:MBL fold metallo-hydrolase [Micromonosporaceae bacterium DT55]|uniref:MBL fold metallo-hydrolase n=1 Tax=Melissospora conviva TaxID=3388432 RepID=UPI003C16678D
MATPTNAHPSRRTLRRVALAAGLAGLAGLAWAARDVPAALGARLTGADAERLRRSPQYRDGAFRNRQNTRMIEVEEDRKVLWEFIFGMQRRRPRLPVPLLRPGQPPPVTDRELNAVWYGHASTLLEIEGRRVLLDPVWSRRCSPSHLVGPRRLHPVPVGIDDLPLLDAILISHDHYDHLDLATVRELTATGRAPFLVPLGVGAHLRRWGVPDERIVELDWSQQHQVAGLTITATAAQHFSGRGLRRDDTLWASWVVAGLHRRVFYTGDSGYFDGYAEIGAAHGPFDLTLMQIGAYSPAWSGIHMFPEQAVTAHRELRGGLLVPVHWATFNLSTHAWAEPVERLCAAAREQDVRVAVPMPGERVVVDAPQRPEPWWRAVT